LIFFKTYRLRVKLTAAANAPVYEPRWNILACFAIQFYMLAQHACAMVSIDAECYTLTQ